MTGREIAEARWQRAEAEGIHIRQGKEEFIEACGRIMADGRKLDNLLEIGSLCGGSAFVLAGLLSEGSKIILIDVCDRGQKVVKALDKTIGLLCEEGFDVRLLRGFSQQPEIMIRTRKELSDGRVGICHIDGCHSTHVVLQDWKEYGSVYVAAGGWCVFHDVVAPGGVRVAWETILADADVGKTWQAQVVGGESWSRANFWATGIGLLHRME